MKSFHPIFWTALFANITFALAVAGEQKVDKATLKSLGNLPMSFEANQGQADPAIKYLARGGHYNLFLTPDEAVLSLKQSTIRMKLIGANRSPKIGGVDPQAGKSNYFRGSDPSRWVTDVPHYGRVEYQNVYAGVNLNYYGNGRQLEYDWIVAPGADPSRIRTQYLGVQAVHVDASGDLILRTPDGDLRHKKPVIYQEIDGRRQPVKGRFVVRGKNQVGFEVAAYNRSRPLIIDPVLAYSSYLGGSSYDDAFGITVDSNGFAYITGDTGSPNFPAGPPQTFHYGQKCTHSYYDSVRGPVTEIEPFPELQVLKKNKD